MTTNSIGNQNNAKSIISNGIHNKQKENQKCKLEIRHHDGVSAAPHMAGGKDRRRSTCRVWRTVRTHQRTNSTLLLATKRHVVVQYVVLIDPHLNGASARESQFTTCGRKEQNQSTHRARLQRIRHAETLCLIGWRRRGPS